jgi:protocatechuate 3,4-dioxygenase beta subunit
MTVKHSRRKALLAAIGASLSALTSTKNWANDSSGDGVGPNRGILEKTLRGKQTCDNTDVLVSDIESRLSTPDDFSGDVCQLLKDSHEGPYFTCSPSVGKAIAPQESGQPLTLAIRLIDSDCQPIEGGVVDVWACNALGYYSGYGNSPDERPPMVKAIVLGHFKPDTEQRFCRGALKTDADGIAEFDTVYPGFYYGQPIHMHMKAHVAGKNLLTTQANFPEDVNQRIMQQAPYSAPRPLERNTKSQGFPIYNVVERNGVLLAAMDLMVPA